MCLQCRRPGFNPWVGKIPWRRDGQPTPVFFPGEFHGQRSLASWFLDCLQFIDVQRGKVNCPKSQSYLVMGLEFESRSVCIDLKLRLPLYIYHSAYTGFPGGSDGKESACNVGDLGLIPGLGRPPREGHGNPLQHSCLENPHEKRGLADCSSRGHQKLDTAERQHSIQYSLPMQQLLYRRGSNANDSYML